MTEQNLILNMLTFNHPVETKEFGFSMVAVKGFYSIHNPEYPELIPNSGTYINICRNQYILCNNSRYGSKMPGRADGYPFPIKISMRSTDEAILDDPKLVNNLIDQIYQFSRMYWKSIRQQNLPVTIKYPEIIAEIAPHFLGNDIPAYGKDKLWFL